MLWEGYNYEDVIILFNCLVEEDVFILIYIEEYEIDVCDIKLGVEEIICDILNIFDEVFVDLDEWGIVCIGVEVCDGDILVGKVILKGEIELMLEEWLLCVIFGEKVCEVCDILLKVLYGEFGKVIGIWVFFCEDEDELLVGVNELVCVYVVQKCKIFDGDKLVGWYGNKGVIGKILLVEDMLFFVDGILVDIILNIYGVL